MNTLLCTDVYKLSHMIMYPEDTVEVYSYLEARKPNPEMVFFGLQYLIREYLLKPITQDNADELLNYYQQILGSVPDKVVMKINALAKLGYWPVEIKAVAEGTVLPTKNVLFTMRNTHPDFYWCVGYLESLLLKVWNTCTVATYSRKYKKLVEKYADDTCDDHNHIPFSVHDFGYRGVSSEETAMTAGAAHLLNFSGSDTIVASWFLDKYYDATKEVKSCSVPASEHSVTCAYGREGEWKALDRMLELCPTGIVSMVSDSYDYWRVLTEYAESRKEVIMKREGKTVFRPDSGFPPNIICGNPEATGEAERLGSLELLWNVFGGTINSKGYRVLDPHVGLIYGDGMYYERFETILERMKLQGFASSNLVIGVGGLLLQQHNRDELGFAIKATRIVKKDGTKIEIFKDPATDPGKASKKGLMFLSKDQEGWKTVDQCSEVFANTGELKTVFLDGATVHSYSFKQIKENILK